MRKRSISVFGLGALLLLAACGGKSEQASKTSAQQTIPAEQKRPHGLTKAENENLSKQIASGMAGMANKNAPKHWGITLDGVDLPALEGSTVLGMELPGQVMHYSFMGPEQVTNVDLEDVKAGQAGTFKAYSLQIIYGTRNYTCGASEMDKNTDVTVIIEPKGDGIRATLDGRVSCSPTTQEGKRERKFATVHAWFEK